MKPIWLRRALVRNDLKITSLIHTIVDQLLIKIFLRKVRVLQNNKVTKLFAWMGKPPRQGFNIVIKTLARIRSLDTNPCIWMRYTL